MSVTRPIRIIRKLDITMTAGLVAPSSRPDANPLWWVEDDSKQKSPPIIRFSWLPVTGELKVGTQVRHALQLRGHDYPFAAWLRGFSFPHDRAIALRTYHWPLDPYEQFGPAQQRVDLRVSRSFLKVARPYLPDRTLIFVGVDNKFLTERFGHLSRSW